MCVGGCMAGGRGQVRVSYHSKGLKKDSCFDYVSAACFVNGSCHGVSHVQAKGHDGVLLEWVAVIRNDGGWGLQLACAIPMPSQTQPHTLLLLQAVASLTFDVHLSTAPLSLFIWIISDTFAMRFCFCPGPLLYQGLKPASRKCSPVHITLRSFYWATSSFVKSYGKRKIQQVCRFHNREENHFIILLLSKKKSDWVLFPEKLKARQGVEDQRKAIQKLRLGENASSSRGVVSFLCCDVARSYLEF